MKKNTLGKKYGIIAGVGMIAYFLLFYLFDKEMMMGLTVSWTSLIILIVCLFIAIQQHRESQGGALDFKEGLRIGFLVVVLGNVLFYAFFFVLLNIDPELVTILKQKSIEFFREYATDPEQEEALVKSYENYSFGISELLSALGRSIIGGFFLALLGALIFKRRTEVES